MADRANDRRRSQWGAVPIPIILQGTDTAGRGFFDRAEVVSVDRKGARIRTRFFLSVGAEVRVQLPTEKEAKRLRVAWCGEVDSLFEGIVGTEFVDPNDSWNVETVLAKWGPKEP